ncbi:ferric-dicitrate binding protein FerR, regulates iron transport through sigma-19 [Robiginitalea myxolifaciens]|uniref:Ferric-dicitrate binding protein FerR, regulates iron transport through sigma-19 n=1 Tax=Robiginitalea myxolifaciens TaxID=400055 RepID=A0A1I6HGQ9_9FLAO|nr:FecR domain-containing protein [Robiginitalea myxolifaciens]SFR53631.1 ferric-dicitrate binding protein FerR, regulates iron transport through sigma-19 [Robiginitalea myxolifaciens]
MEENYLAKWLNNELSAAEEAEFRNHPDYPSYARIVKASSELRAPEFDVEAALNRVRAAQSITEPKVIRMRRSRPWMAAAAAILVFLSVGFFFWNSQQPTAASGYAQQTEIALPDQSQVTLNAGSEIYYDEDHWGEDRRVRLEGEAFFKVAKGQTFTVETEVGQVTVLGTEFNVQQRNGVFIVSCYEGLVRVDHGGQQIQLPAGTRFSLVGNDLETGTVTAGSVPSWMEDESSFTSMPLSFVLEEFERQFNIRVTTRGIDMDAKFSGSFSNTNMDLALKSISTPLQIKHEVNGNKVLFYAENAP